MWSCKQISKHTIRFDFYFTFPLLKIIYFLPSLNQQAFLKSNKFHRFLIKNSSQFFRQHITIISQIIHIIHGIFLTTSLIKQKNHHFPFTFKNHYIFLFSQSQKNYHLFLLVQHTKIKSFNIFISIFIKLHQQVSFFILPNLLPFIRKCCIIRLFKLL